MEVGVAAVHLEKVGREERRLLAAGAQPDLDDDVLLVLGITGDKGQLQRGFQPITLRLLLAELLARVSLHLLVLLRLRQLAGLLDGLLGAPVCGVEIDQLPQLRLLLAQPLQLL